ncbi:head-tail adaptor protein [Aquibaculum arenosum]|uniref:Head-tail adaptor protein n=1 Tax=Aquibaculum arenosum TaxID=3032591 RepID=A0ABT5YQR6_9PROT|nr:head-tail adaptor protein [Fodinicurvata sp. CAU 1616]MDF2097311.1 head-tail adaptor protein [Fodinicurvata sp. CAU 1616]
MIAARLDTPLRLERSQPLADGRGGWVEDWVLLQETHGSLQHLRSRTQRDGGRLQAEVTHALFLPPETGAVLGDRVVIAGRNYRVVAAGLGRAGRYDKLLLRAFETAAG